MPPSQPTDEPATDGRASDATVGAAAAQPPPAAGRLADGSTTSENDETIAAPAIVGEGEAGTDGQTVAAQSVACRPGLPSTCSFVVPDSPALRVTTPLMVSSPHRPPRHPGRTPSRSVSAAALDYVVSGGGSTAAPTPGGEDADSEASTAHCTRANSMVQLASAVWTPARPKANSIDVLSGGAGLPLFHADRLDFNAATATPAQGHGQGRGLPPSRRNGSAFNLLLSSHLSSMFGGDDHGSASAASSPGPARPNLLARLRHLLSPLAHWSPRGTAYYLLFSLFVAYLVRAASQPHRRLRTMLTFGPPMVAREAPHILMAAVVLAMLRSMHQQLHSFPNWSLLGGWLANLTSLAGLAGLFGSIVRDGAAPFRRQMAAAAIRMPHQLAASEESVLTIAPAAHDQAGTVQPLEAEGTSAESLPPVIGSGILDASDSSCAVSASRAAAAEGFDSSDLVVASSQSDPRLSAYRRIGRMSPLRWFLTATQLSRTLAWSEEIRWKTGVVFEKLYTRHKTKALKLDMYRPKQEAGAPKPKLPVFLYIHGGGWVTGHRSFHSLTLLYAVAKAGFIVVSVNYRLSPWVKHPTHLMDCKRSLAWVRQHADEIGADASCIVVGGESAGSHLAMLLALTPNVPYLQPGFEDVDTSVAGVVDLYGSHDFTDSHLHFRSRERPGSFGFDQWLHRAVMGAPVAESRDEYEMASPLFRLKHFAYPAATLPPFFGAHGMADDLIPVGDSDEFYRALRDKRREAQNEYEEQMKQHQERVAGSPAAAAAAVSASGAATPAGSASTSPLVPLAPLAPFPPHDVYVRLPGASHAFNNVMSKRSFALNDSITAWLLSLLHHHRQRAIVIQQRREHFRTMAASGNLSAQAHAHAQAQLDQMLVPSSSPPNLTVAPASTDSPLSHEMRRAEELTNSSDSHLSEPQPHSPNASLYPPSPSSGAIILVPKL